MSQTPYYVPRAPYAEDPSKSKGRRFKEDESRTRTPFARDRDRIIHTSAFRRLKEKTQVFVAHEGDNFRTRLTHTLEVAQVARSLATALGLDADLAETIALAHDLGHPPFGHAGEDELEIQMREYGGFDHNVQTFRVVTELEHRYPDFVGLNLTWETLEGVIKHNGPVTNKLGKPSWKAISKYDNEYELGLNTWASAEAQVAALADDIAYNNHDVDDGVTAGLFTLDELMDVPLIGPILAAVKSERPDLDARLTHLEAVRRMIGAMVDDVMGETLHRAAASGVQSADDVRALDHALVAFSSDMAEDLARLRGFLYERMYRHWRVNRTRSQARRILGEMFSLFLREPEVLPTVWFAKSQNRDEAGRARVVCDYIAGMTDRFAIEEHRKLFHLDVWN
ncbi:MULTISPECIES: deoxyguanosinetriphosphate triphosphohydrolase [unclassified Caulobacter]|jgi:dGTPase|uniref:deoxyguanosinetriphosphate triphosphohydrolase n=1 Tax=unclassified Caulobacter TaxID=2648921 RepID=UPI000782CBF7|nr:MULTISPECIES: deoxyguanosinetriphosphate triphosphohydrolase [unclassified Caulobacter]AZS21018.1 deoxyguanosinetriphosphate triphosphohydrolase [Caulobacter sp. FWC26]MCA0355635.1 deoxyguanosinetriphosphate triphosphohydrolase [Pseudomonadota bacterium]